MTNKVRRLCLGGVSSLSFEEDERRSLEDRLNGQRRRHYLHEMLTDCLEEQVEHLLAAAYDSPESAVAFYGLHATLSDAVHRILRLSESEPYGVRGATIILKLVESKKSQAAVKDRERSIGVVAVDAATVSTFHLHLTLREEPKTFALALRNWIGQMFSPQFQQVRMISPNFSLRKEPLYRSSSGSSLVQYH